MPWKEITTMSQKASFVKQAKADNANISALCRSFEISRKTGYKWLKRDLEEGSLGLENRSRRPKHSPGQTTTNIEALVLEVRNEHPVWGGRKIRRVLQNRGYDEIPAASTITAILRRNALINPEEAQKHQPFKRFAREQPNELWQMDFKGYFALQNGGYCHPLTVIDDHSRFLVGLKACPNQTAGTVQAQLSAVFEQFGLPESLLMDNGSPWGDDEHNRNTIFTSWLMRLGIIISHGRPYHPQTQGKDERLNRTLLEEVISKHTMATLCESQAHFDAWQYTYNYIRPHEALQLDTPGDHYHPSLRPFPSILPPITYEPDDLIRKVDEGGKIYFHNRRFRIGKAFRHQPVALRPAEKDGIFLIVFCNTVVAQINLRKDNC